MVLVDILAYLLILQLILPSDAAFAVGNNSPINTVLPLSANSVTDASLIQDHAERLMESMESTNDPITRCMICKAIGCVSSSPIPYHQYVDADPYQTEVVTYREQNHASTSAVEMKLTQNNVESIQIDERQEQEDDDVHTIVHITHDVGMNNDHDADDAADADDANDDENCLIECGNDESSPKCTALYHKKCLSKQITTSKKEVCLMCNRMLSQTVLLQCTNDQSQNIQQTSAPKRIIHKRVRHPAWPLYSDGCTKGVAVICLIVFTAILIWALITQKTD